MKIYRHMSWNEYRKLKDGIPLANHSEHLESNTTSKGFCFFPFKSHADVEKKFIGSVAGIVSSEVVVVLEVSENKLHKGIGTYHDPDASNSLLSVLDCLCWDCDQAIQLTEFWTEEYGKKQGFKILEFGFPNPNDFFETFVWNKGIPYFLRGDNQANESEEGISKCKKSSL